MNILGIKLAEEQELANGAVDTGYRVLLSVTYILAKVQTTVMFGNSLYLIANHVGQMNGEDAFNAFVGQFINKPKTWGQLVEVPPPLRAHFFTGIPMPQPPASEGILTVLSSGYDPMRGMYVEFAGNFFLSFPLFQDFKNVFNEVPRYKS
jgi:hypothetical protein